MSCFNALFLSVYFSLTWCLERKIPVGKKPVSLSKVPMTGVVRRSFSGDEELTPPQYRTLPAQTAPEASQPPRTSRKFSPSLKTGNWSCKKANKPLLLQTVKLTEDQVWTGVKHADSLPPSLFIKNRKNIHFLWLCISPFHLN